jgi:beta-1,4-mannosyl-glycoprotein beta-1,4-N-acetylglucosaminyltransferase
MTAIVKKKIIDCFTFFDEHELLQYRLNLLRDVVDTFILVEATHTHRGIPKPLYFEEKKALYEEFSIIHIIVDDFPFPDTKMNPAQFENEIWVNEMYQRRCIQRGLESLNLSPEDLFTITDLDEIPDPNTLYDIKNSKMPITIHCLEMDFYYYNLHTRHHRKWYHPKLCSYQAYKNYGKPVDEIRMTQFPAMKRGGWHLSYFGDKYRIQAKINRCLHTELSLEKHNDLDQIESNMKNHKDLYGRPGEVFEHIRPEHNKYLPSGYEAFIPQFI